jgi:hypothetical protein
MNRTQTLDSRLNIEKGTSPSTPRGPAPSINGHVDYRNADFGENIETRALHVAIDEDRDARKPTADDLDNEATEPTDGDKQIDDPIHIYLMMIRSTRCTRTCSRAASPTCWPG